MNFEWLPGLIQNPNCKPAVLKKYCSIRGSEGSTLLEQRIALEASEALESFNGCLWSFAIKSQLDLTPFVKEVDENMLSLWYCYGYVEPFLARNRDTEIKTLITSVMEDAEQQPYDSKIGDKYFLIRDFLNDVISQTSSVDLLTFTEEKRIFVQKKFVFD